MDAFAVAVTNGLTVSRHKLRSALMCACSFGVFQGIMPLAGYFLGISFAQKISALDHWIALVLLAFIGFKMIADAVTADEEKADNAALSVSVVFLQSIATSIDALAVGVSFAALSADIVSAAFFICAVTFVISLAGFYIGRAAGAKLTSKARLFGGVVLVLIGLKIFISHVV